MQVSISQTDDKIDEKAKEYVMDYERFPCGIAVIKNDEFSTLLRANPAFYNIIGHSQQEFQEAYQNRMNQILVDNFFDTVQKQTIKEDYDVVWDMRISTSTGEVRWIHDVAHYNAELDAFFVIFIDITDKMVASSTDLSYEAFQAKHDILLYLSKYTSKHFIVTDLETDKVIYMSTSAMKLSGFQRESDWRGKTYPEIAFGSLENTPEVYYVPLKEDEFTEREYYNQFHKIYAKVESKIFSIPSLHRKMRLDIINDITAQKQLEHRMVFRTTLYNCIESLFTIGSTDRKTEDAYFEVLGQLKSFYHASEAFFYKLKDQTKEVEMSYRVLLDDSTLVQPNVDYPVPDSLNIAINNAQDHRIACMGVINPKYNEDDKELMQLVSRFICMFIEHEQDDRHKEEALKLEMISKTNLVEQCMKNFQSLAHAKDNVVHTLDALCRHYDADFAIIISRTEQNAYGVTHVSGGAIPDLSGLSQSSHFMGNWLDTFEKHTHFASDLDFDDANAPIIKKMLLERFGIYNFVASPMRDANGALTGLLIVSNFQLTNRSHLMVHVVTNSVATYLAKVSLYNTTQLEPTTELANKVATESRISKLLEEKTNGTLFVIDIDNFKRLNDTLGHQMGDIAIMDVADVLKKLFRATDIIGRIGGDEFMVYSPNLVSDDLIEMKARQIIENSHLKYEKDGLSIELSTSIGICSVNGSQNTFESIYAKADYALYRAKKNGKNQYHKDVSMEVPQ